MYCKLVHVGVSARVNFPFSAWDFDVVQEFLRPTLAAAMMPKKSKKHKEAYSYGYLAIEILSGI